MKVIAAIDDKKGMFFNNRRQSQDRLLRKKILSVASGSKLWMNNYTKNQFLSEKIPEFLIVDDDFLSKADEKDYCFVENISLSPYSKKIREVILFKWNRIYPADMFFDLDLEEQGWKHIYSDDFKGFSHKTITMEVWLRE